MSPAKRAPAPKPRATPSGPTTSGAVTLLIGTKKGAFFLKSDPARKRWKLGGPAFLGCMVHHLVSDPRERRTLVAAVRTGHLGPTVYRSEDNGKSWKEAARPPQFARAKDGGRAVDHVFWIRPGHASEPGVWWAGTSPQGLFRSADGGATWSGVAGFNEHPLLETWTGGAKDGTPDGPKLHSIGIDPRDARHMYVGCSSGGVFESTDGGARWEPLNQGCAADFLPTPDAEYGHDPHCLALHPLAPDVLWQQNHCGIYRMLHTGGASDRWERVGNNMPKAVGDIGFPIVLHPRDPDTVWVFPMDGGTVWPRTSPGGKPAVFTTRDAGKRWQRLAQGLPRAKAWLTVMRQGMACDAHAPVGLYFGTTSGEVWASRDEGRTFSRIAEHLPRVWAVEVAGRVQ